MKDTNKFIESATDESQRTFETRLEFIRQIFTNKYSEDDIFKKCVEHKLDRSFELYTQEVNACLNRLYAKDPIKILKREAKKGDN